MHSCLNRSSSIQKNEFPKKFQGTASSPLLLGLYATDYTLLEIRDFAPWPIAVSFTKKDH